MSPQGILALNEILEIEDPLRVTLWFPGEPSRSITLDTTIKHITENQLLIAIPTVENSEVLLRQGVRVEIEFLNRNQDLPQIETWILRYQKDAIVSGFWVEIPASFQEYFLKRRQHVRIPVRFPVQVIYTVNGRPRIIDGESINLSGGGVRFTSQQIYSPGDKIMISFQPDNRYQLFKLNGEVIFCSPSPYRTPKTPNETVTALKFINMPRAHEDQLVGFCFRKELEQHKHLK